MKYFVQFKFRELKMTHKNQEFQFFFILIIFQILHFGPQIFQKFQIDPNKFPKL